MRLAVASLIALASAACGGGGGDLTGEIEVPDGYVRFSGAGVSFVHPVGWRVNQGKDPDGAPSVEVTAPGQSETPGPLIQLTISPQAGDRFDSLVDQRRLVVEKLNGGKIASEEKVELRGAERTLRTSTNTPPNKAPNSVAFKSAAVDVLRDNGDVVVLTAATPQRGEPKLDPEAVIDSFRLQAGA